MLLRMYTRWAEQQPATRSSPRSSTPAKRPASSRPRSQVKGPNAYGWLKTESGVHRLVRISPFDSNARRHTSFASVWVYPVDRRHDRDRHQRSGRAHRYLPLVRRRRPARQHHRLRGAHHPHPDRHRRPVPERALAAQEPRHGLGDAARAPLRGRAGEARGGRAAAAASKTDIGWGHQIRSYVLQPYQLVKDLRTGVESTSPHACSTATSIRSWKPRCRSASGGDVKEVADLQSGQSEACPRALPRQSRQARARSASPPTERPSSLPARI